MEINDCGELLREVRPVAYALRKSSAQHALLRSLVSCLLCIFENLKKEMVMILISMCGCTGGGGGGGGGGR